MGIYERLYGPIHDVLIKEWDPIGVGDQPLAQDEYDSYIPGIINLLTIGADRVRLIDHLQQLETVSMGLRGDCERNTLVAKRLLEVYVESANHQ